MKSNLETLHPVKSHSKATERTAWSGHPL